MQSRDQDHCPALALSTQMTPVSLVYPSSQALTKGPFVRSMFLGTLKRAYV